MHAELHQHTLRVMAGSVWTDTETLRDGNVGETRLEELRDLDLAGGESVIALEPGRAARRRRSSRRRLGIRLAVQPLPVGVDFVHRSAERRHQYQATLSQLGEVRPKGGDSRGRDRPTVGPDRWRAGRNVDALVGHCTSSCGCTTFAHDLPSSQYR